MKTTILIGLTLLLLLSACEQEVEFTTSYEHTDSYWILDIIKIGQLIDRLEQQNKVIDSSNTFTLSNFSDQQFNSSKMVKWKINLSVLNNFSGIMIFNDTYCDEFTCDCATNTSKPCMAYCVACEEEEDITTFTLVNRANNTQFNPVSHVAKSNDLNMSLLKYAGLSVSSVWVYHVPDAEREHVINLVQCVTVVDGEEYCKR